MDFLFHQFDDPEYHVIFCDQFDLDSMNLFRKISRVLLDDYLELISNYYFEVLIHLLLFWGDQIYFGLIKLLFWGEQRKGAHHHPELAVGNLS